MSIRGIRGATTVSMNDASAILEATQELLLDIQESNSGLKAEDVVSALFTLTPDLNAAYPAKAARELGWMNVPLICAQEIPVPEGLTHCIRVLLHWNTDLLRMRSNTATFVKQLLFVQIYYPKKQKDFT